MQVGGSQASGNSSRSRSQSSWAKSPRRSRGGKVPQWCHCGMRLVLRWYGTDLNPDRPFYGCPKYNTSGNQWCGVFEWANCEDDENMVVRAQSETNPMKMSLGFRVSKLEAEVRGLKIRVFVMGILMMLVLVGIVGHGLVYVNKFDNL
ncbi:hypothetical protein PIB30_047343 [Stylosanthes scabra]|uniref:GRF-type domain-containing protein n=1 Tax=Stylosanthes scabra TaxID=79078 RepID=A0ABU6SHF1_9FABA|nr:hypothetical protein [Stylosanthes scabra]